MDGLKKDRIVLDRFFKTRKKGRPVFLAKVRPAALNLTPERGA
jgi:hypothetical protein